MAVTLVICKCLCATEVSEEKTDCSKNPISALIIPVDRHILTDTRLRYSRP